MYKCYSFQNISIYITQFSEIQDFKIHSSTFESQELEEGFQLNSCESVPKLALPINSRAGINGRARLIPLEPRDPSARFLPRRRGRRGGRTRYSRVGPDPPARVPCRLRRRRRCTGENDSVEYEYAGGRSHLVGS